MKDQDIYLTLRLNDYRNRLKKERKELRLLPDGSLGFRQSSSSTEYVHLYKDKEHDNSYIRKGITKNDHITNKLARKKYLQASIKMLEKEISLLENYLSKHIEPTTQNILDTLPLKYQQLPEELYFPQKRAGKKWQNQPFEQNSKNLHEKVHITSKGLRVRSKSELIIAEKLDALGIPYRYEALIHYKNLTFSPDFTIYLNGVLKYWEHCGMMSDPEYRKYNTWKLDIYEEMGIVPWNNLIITYDTVDGAINSSVIDAEISNKLLGSTIYG